MNRNELLLFRELERKRRKQGRVIGWMHHADWQTPASVRFTTIALKGRANALKRKRRV